MRVYAVAAATAVVAMLGATWWFSRDAGTESCSASTVAGGAGSIGGPFELVSETGETVTDAEVITKPSIVYFGYTFCPDICPLDAARNAAALNILAEEGIDAQALFITVDPERDTPEVLREFTDVMHPEMIGLTGSPAQVDAAAKAYKTYYAKQTPEEGMEDFYLVDHTTFSYLVLPEEGFVEFFRRETTPEQIAETVACFVK